ncbi:hypothetical protein MIND_01116100 [Mycena indigotica]|uniref:DUF6589 domain-containing protein n=1 Tax=Mycena indigotica TaxID=2126181 RepID=A0A8H6S5U6_9AGAR|nr:uncharacterized protein MIND_01116100 [Mycena indigotica]KAF7293391.1 hypothetical protein MIND_01116100 [Mycena indigotica]
MMDSACASAQENATILEDMLVKQAGLGDPAQHPNTTPLGNRIVLVFGDLGVGDRIQSAKASRSEESTAWRRLENIVYVMGLFHVKMACADAIHRAFIAAKPARKDTDKYSLFHHAETIRRKESSKIQTKPGFRLMHEIILHTGIGCRLDIWRTFIKKINSQWTSLEKYAESMPLFDDICAVSRRIVMEYVAKRDIISKLRKTVYWGSGYGSGKYASPAANLSSI